MDDGNSTFGTAGSSGKSREVNGIWKSTDAGTTWTQMFGGVTNAVVRVTDIDYTFNQTNGTLRLFAGIEFPGGLKSSAGVYLSDDGGANWSPNNLLPINSDIGRITLAADHTSGSQTIYAAVDRNSDNTLLNIYKSVVNGTLWTATNPPGYPAGQAPNGQGSYDLALGLSPSGRVYFGGVSYPGNNPPQYGYLESNVGATSWRAVDVDVNNHMPHTDGHAFAFTPDGTVYLGCDGGVYRLNPLPFDPAPNYYDTNPNYVAVGDFNRDGKPDIATASYGGATNGVSVLINNGNNSFQSQSLLNGGLYIVGLATADFNGDGAADIAAIDADGSVMVLLGNGNGTFATAVSYPTGIHYVEGISVGDFNGDGRPDIAVASQQNNGVGQNSVSVLINKNNGTGTFNAAMISPGGTTPVGIAAADFNGDGKTDLVTYAASGTVSVLMSNGNGSFAAPVLYQTGLSLNGVTVGDFNGDGKPDIGLASRSSNTVDIMLNSGTGTFGAWSGFGGGTAPSSVVAADFNGDGRADLATISATTGSISVILNNGNATFRFADSYATSYTSSSVIPSAVGVGDFNSDGAPDLVTANSGGYGLSVLMNNPKVPRQGRGLWDDLNTLGLQTNQVNDVSLSPANTSSVATMLEGSQDNGSALTTNGGSSWATIGGGDGEVVRYDPSDPTGQIAYRLTQNGQLYRSTNGGLNWTLIHAADKTKFPFYAPFVIDPTASNILYLGGWGIRSTFPVTAGRHGPQRDHPSAAAVRTTLPRSPWPRGRISLSMLGTRPATST